MIGRPLLLINLLAEWYNLFPSISGSIMTGPYILRVLSVEASSFITVLESVLHAKAYTVYLSSPKVPYLFYLK